MTFHRHALVETVETKDEKIKEGGYSGAKLSFIAGDFPNKLMKREEKDKYRIF